MNDYELPVEELELSPYISQLMRNNGLDTVGAVMDVWDQYGGNSFLNIQGFDEQALQQLIDQLHAKGYLIT